MGRNPQPGFPLRQDYPVCGQIVKQRCGPGRVRRKKGHAFRASIQVIIGKQVIIQHFQSICKYTGYSYQMLINIDNPDLKKQLHYGNCGGNCRPVIITGFITSCRFGKFRMTAQKLICLPFGAGRKRARVDSDARCRREADRSAGGSSETESHIPLILVQLKPSAVYRFRSPPRL